MTPSYRTSGGYSYHCIIEVYGTWYGIYHAIEWWRTIVLYHSSRCHHRSESAPRVSLQSSLSVPRITVANGSRVDPENDWSSVFSCHRASSPRRPEVPFLTEKLHDMYRNVAYKTVLSAISKTRTGSQIVIGGQDVRDLSIIVSRVGCWIPVDENPKRREVFPSHSLS